MDLLIMLGRALALLLAAVWISHILTAGVDDITRTPYVHPVSENGAP